MSFLDALAQMCAVATTAFSVQDEMDRRPVSATLHVCLIALLSLVLGCVQCTTEVALLTLDGRWNKCHTSFSLLHPHTGLLTGTYHPQLTDEEVEVQRGQ